MCILVVEDEPLIRLIVVEELQDAGFDVCQAETGDAAAELIRLSRQDIIMLITDIHMPGQLNGLDVAEIVRGRYPTAPIIYTTGRPDVLEALGHLRPHDALLSKPFVPSKLMATVRELLSL